MTCVAAGGGTVGRTPGRNQWRFTTVRSRRVGMTHCRAAAAATAAAAASDAVTRVLRL